jgi:hypothetical protein
VEQRKFLDFEESHCHAPHQFLYEPLDATHRQWFANAPELIIIDDEMSTGSTMCNLVDAYRAYNPALQRAHFVSITNFSGEDCAARFSLRTGLPVTCVSALQGSFSFASCNTARLEVAGPAVGANQCEAGFVADHLGRFGIDRRIRIPAEDVPRLVEGLLPGAPILVLGTGEFMHVAFRLGLELEARGFAVRVQATTRSPILPGADIHRRMEFPDNYGEGIRNYLYNVDPDHYARIILCHETPSDGISDLSQQLGSVCFPYRYASPG